MEGIFRRSHPKLLLLAHSVRNIHPTRNEQDLVYFSPARSISHIQPFLPQLLADLPRSRSPIASLSYVLWNIKVTGKCALMSDTAVGIDTYDDEESPFAQARDALYILSVMNQCECFFS